MNSIGQVAAHETLVNAFGRSIKGGVVRQVDKEKGYRISFGKVDGEEYLSPWIPHPESSKSSVPLKVGEIVGLVSPAGDLRQGFLLRGGYTEKHPSPNQDMGANVFKDGDLSVTVNDGALLINAGGVSFSFSTAGFSQKGGAVKHDDHDIGSSHRHGGIAAGSDQTDVPL